MRLLIVEDHLITSQLMKGILSEYGECEVAYNGKEAVEVFKKNMMTEGKLFDVIFLDILMPEMDGHQALEQIRQIESDYGIEGLQCVKIIMTTAKDDKETIINSFKYQCDGYVVKPISKEIIKNKLVELKVI